MKNRKGIILAGGAGTRLYPTTHVVSKQLIPLYDKPMIYYPLATLMQGGMREILIISTPDHIDLYKTLLKDGSQWGVEIQYITQPSPDGLAQSFILGEEFIDESPSALILGDNFFYGNNLPSLLKEATDRREISSIFAYHVKDPSRYGIVNFDSNNNVLDIEEKPNKPRSNFAVTGLYFYDENAVRFAKELSPSERGELEITDLNKRYLKIKKLKVTILRSGFSWLDTGTHDSLLEASNFVSIIQNRQGLKIACLEQIALENQWISIKDIERQISSIGSNSYQEYLRSIIS
ncbi:glucose-1-phosphate thymidylyltransferase RfbA [Pseudomonadota bacterium]|nr:glucose-1-phosphate thymidylyltransferase [Euryarchaeota archaeon]MDC0181040.1 glucose-1-phosphate thymidylyltransferase RfbA [Pseudomonadota bacterium]|tara:strand:+ start:28686 stop:29558 length:873 start_codon:yes stop_codon:yes gene_type:complete